MPKKRKAEANGLDEMDRQLYGTFRTAANSISALYTSSLSLQKRAFNAGARHATERLLAWALSHGEGQLSAADLAAALQAELVVLEGEDAALQAAADGVGGGVDQQHGGGADHPGHAHNTPPTSRAPPTEGREERVHLGAMPTGDDRRQRDDARVERPSERFGSEVGAGVHHDGRSGDACLLYTSPSPRDKRQSRMPSSA